MSSDNVELATLLRRLGVTGEVREFDESTRTAAEAAQALGCEVGAIANSLVFVADGADPVLILASGAHRVDTELVAGHFGSTELRRATPEQVRAATGQTIGGVAPIGHPSALRTFIDTALRSYSVIWASAGSSHSVFSTTFAELARIANAEEISVAALSEGSVASDKHRLDHLFDPHRKRFTSQCERRS